MEQDGEDGLCPQPGGPVAEHSDHPTPGVPAQENACWYRCGSSCVGHRVVPSMYSPGGSIASTHSSLDLLDPRWKADSPDKLARRHDGGGSDGLSEQDDDVPTPCLCPLRQNCPGHSQLERNGFLLDLRATAPWPLVPDPQPSMQKVLPLAAQLDLCARAEPCVEEQDGAQGVPWGAQWDARSCGRHA